MVRSQANGALSERSDCLEASAVREHAVHDHRDGGIWVVSIAQGTCEIDLSAVGQVSVTADANTISGIQSSGSLIVKSTTPDGETTLVEQPSAGSNVTYILNRGGKTVPFDQAGAAWLARVLLVVDRYTGFAADQRVPALLAAGGAGRVIDEVNRMADEHARVVYLLRLLTDPTLDAAGLQRVSDSARGLPEAGRQRVLNAIAGRLLPGDQAGRLPQEAASRSVPFRPHTRIVH
jgi:hypothetical protein